MLYEMKNLENKISIREIEIHTISEKKVSLGLIIFMKILT